MSLDELLATRSAMIVASEISPAIAATARAGFRYTRYDLIDRGSYAFADAPDVPELVSAITAKILEVTGERRRLIASRVLRLVPGDYLLAHHDRVHEERALECVVDLSPASVPAEVHYRQHGQVFFRVPCEPGTVAMVPRGPTVSCNHTYVSKLCTGAEVVRWIALFA